MKKLIARKSYAADNDMMCSIFKLVVCESNYTLDILGICSHILYHCVNPSIPYFPKKSIIKVLQVKIDNKVTHELLRKIID